MVPRTSPNLSALTRLTALGSAVGERGTAGEAPPATNVTNVEACLVHTGYMLCPAYSQITQQKTKVTSLEFLAEAQLLGEQTATLER